MALIEKWEKTGEVLFRHRGQIPILFFLAGLIVIYLYPYSENPGFLYRSISYLFVSMIGELIRIQTLGRAAEKTSGGNRKKQVAERLNTSGWYSIVRHPLYLGNFFLWLGIALFTESFSFILIICLIFWLYYERIMFTEESFLRKKFGKRFLAWSEQTPAFLPRFKNYKKPEYPFHPKRVFLSEYHILIEIPAIFFIMNVVRNYHFTHTFQPDCFWVYLLATGFTLWVFALIIVIRIKRLRKGRTVDDPL